MTTLYRALAGAVVVLHLGFVLFVMLGGLAVRRWPRLVWAHLPAVAWGIWIEASGRICPLTPLENHLRELGSEAGYQGGFVEHYLLPALYPEALTRSVQWSLAALVLAVNAFAYCQLLRLQRLHRSRCRHRCHCRHCRHGRHGDDGRGDLEGCEGCAGREGRDAGSGARSGRPAPRAPVRRLP